MLAIQQIKLFKFCRSILAASFSCASILGIAASPYEMLPRPDGKLAYQIIPIPDGLKAEKDVMISMPDGVLLAANVFRPDMQGRFPVILSMTPYGKDQTPPMFSPDGLPAPDSYTPFVERVHAHGADIGHMKISVLTPWEAPDPAAWIPHGYVVIHVDRRGDFKSKGRNPNPVQQGQDIAQVIAWAARQEWSNGKVGMMGVSALASNQYFTAALQPAPEALKAIVPWEGQMDLYRDSAFWGGIPETNFLKRDVKAALVGVPNERAEKIWAEAINPVANQRMLASAAKVEQIQVPTLLCASWTDKGLHTRGTFEAFRRIGTRDKWLYTHGGRKWERFYSEDAVATQKKFFDYYLKGIENGWTETPRVRLEVRETRDEYTVRFEKSFPIERTNYQRLYLDGRSGALVPKVPKKSTVSYMAQQGGDASFGISFAHDTEITGYIRSKLWVTAKNADDMDLFVVVKKFDVNGNEVQFRGMNGFGGDVAAKGQMRVSQRELDPKLSTSWQPVQKFAGEQKLKPGSMVEVDIALLPSSTLFRAGESLRFYIQGRHPTIQPLLFYDSTVNKGPHQVQTGGRFASYIELPVIP